MGTPIQGKIYQMYNKETGANKEKRFPITVIEAVLGLSSYLQNQFSSLADIYMPIGGIYQSQTGLEFVYRATPNTIKAKSFTLDRIQGKSLAWNNSAENGDFSDGSNSWEVASSTCTLSVTGATLTITKANTADYGGICVSSSVTANSTHKYYVCAYCKSNTSSISAGIGFRTSNYVQGGNIILSTTSSTFVYLSGVVSPVNNTDVFSLAVGSAASSTGVNASFKNVMVVDLTLLYGSEIDGMTNAEILAKFESEYPGYHGYSAGKLISNDAKQLETVGRNVWDEEWEVGDINGSTGQNSPSNTQIRSKNYIPIFPETEYYFKAPTTISYPRPRFYDAEKNYIGSAQYNGTDVSKNSIFKTPTNAYYMRFSPSGYGTTYNHDICINLSDTSFNGQYEPYRKVVLPLNLDDFWVKDSQGNQVHITGGLKSAGSVYDEIVGNKYIKRVGSVDLGTLGWGARDEKNDVFEAEVTGRASASLNSKTAKYLNVGRISSVASMQTMTFGSHGSSATIFICNSSFAGYTRQQVQSALSEEILYYELATPIEYDLVEPLIYTMKAGTTEARISPNEDGLSAPFCCDMTYSASDNNDADNAQYAATAGRLLNTHTILGQQFNGTQDIGGAISDVSSIDGAIHFDLTDPNSPKVGISTTTIPDRLTVNGNVRATQLISKATAGTPPLSVDSGTMVPTLNVEKVGGKTLAEILASDITGNAKTATNAKSESKDDQEFMFRKTNVDWDAKSGVVKKIKGKTLAWNQLVTNGNFEDASSWRADGATIAASSNTLTWTPRDATSYYNLYQPIRFVNGHLYYVCLYIRGNKTNTLDATVGNAAGGGTIYFSSIAIDTTWKRFSGYARPASATAYNIYFRPNNAGLSDYVAYFKNVNVIDLTLLYGNEIAGMTDAQILAKFESEYPGYHDYSAGKLINNDAKQLETVGRNVWDEEWRNDGWWNNSGEWVLNPNYLSSKNKIKVLAGQTYYHKFPLNGYIRYYDSNGNYISSYTTARIEDTFTIPDGVSLIAFSLYFSGGTTYNHDICINLSNPAINGQYFPYWKRDLQLNITTRKDTDGNVPFADGMKGAGTAADWADNVGGEIIMREVDLGGFTWVLVEDSLYRVNLSAVISKPETNWHAGNIICAKYATNSRNGMLDKTIAVSADGNVFIKDSAFSGYTEAQVAAALSGVFLDYELATPVPFTWKEPIPSVYPCDQYGTERIIYPESTTPSAPFIADLQYGAKSDDVAKELIDTRAVVDTLLTSGKPALFSTVTATDAITLAGTTAAKKRIYFSNSVYLELDSNGLHLHGAGFYSDSFISAFGTNQTI